MSILDYLNEDCWRLALSYVPVCDVIRTERVSRRWQTVVLRYLASIRIGIQKRDTYIFLRYGIEHWLNVETINLPSFELWSNKLGEAVVVVYCDSEQSLKIVGKHCPNVKAVTFFELPEHLISAFGTFKELEAICFSNCDVSDDCVGEFLANNDIKFLDIWTTNARITGQCFSKRTENLKRLVLYDCKELDLHHLINADLRGLIELELHFAPVEITRNMRSLLRNMPNLVVLDVTDDEQMCKGFFEAVSELSCLEFLYASFAVTDEEFVLIARSCGRLRALILDNCSFVTRRGVAAACARAGAQFVWLGVAGADVANADVEAAVRACPNLMWLDVRWCERLTPALLPRVAAARRELRARRPLRVLVSYTDLYGTEWLDVRWCERLTPALLPRVAAARRELRARRPLRVLVSYTDLYGTETMQEECFPRFLNDDCWKYLLDYVQVKDIVSVAKVCSGWEAIVQHYFQGVGLRVETITNIWPEDEESLQRRRKRRTLIIEDDNVYFNAVLSKWGHFVMELVYDARLADEDVLWDLGVKCPNVQNITFIGLKWNMSRCAWAANFTNLKRICFENGSISDDCIGEFIKNNNIEELVIRMVDSVTGSFLVQNGGSLSDLNTIILFRSCQFRQLMSAVEPVNYLFGVKKLDIRELSYYIHGRAHLFIAHLPQLENLTLDCGIRSLNVELIEAVGRLDRLRRLGWAEGVVLRGCELKAALDDVSCLMQPRARLNRDRELYWRWREYRLVLYRRQHPNTPMRCGRYHMEP